MSASHVPSYLTDEELKKRAEHDQREKIKDGEACQAVTVSAVHDLRA